MIRNFELFCKLNNLKTSELILFKKTCQSFHPETHPCPSCGAKGSWEKHGYYERYLIYLKNGEITTEILIVPRFCCTCGHTHALLPACLIPYGSYSLFFILAVLRAYFLRHRTVDVLCESFRISSSTLYSWIRLYRTHKSLWMGVLADSSSSDSVFLSSLLEEADFLHRFFCQMSFSFLQGMTLATPSRRSNRSADP